MQHRIRPFLGPLAYSLLGSAIGIGCAVLWLYVLAPGWPLWLTGAAAAGCALLLLTAAAHTGWPRSRRRAHARSRTHIVRKAA